MNLHFAKMKAKKSLLFGSDTECLLTDTECLARSGNMLTSASLLEMTEENNDIAEYTQAVTLQQTETVISMPETNNNEISPDTGICDVMKRYKVILSLLLCAFLCIIGVALVFFKFKH